ncbi:MAG: hypothetical protein HY762_06950 [Planctomycetes bacterium]|nr:hypothetical protein [Planctomycetota bacterium]
MLSFISKLLQHILRELEKSPSRLFRASELKRISESDFDYLLKGKLLKYHRYNPDGDYYPCDSGCSSCNSDYQRIVGKVAGKWEAVCPDGEADTKSIPLTDDDITKYSFDINCFISNISRENGFSGKTSVLDARNKRLYFIGSKNIGKQNIGLVLVLLSNEQTSESILLSIPQRLRRYHTRIVLVPFF